MSGGKLVAPHFRIQILTLPALLRLHSNGFRVPVPVPYAKAWFGAVSGARNRLQMTRLAPAEAGGRTIAMTRGQMMGDREGPGVQD